MNTPHLIQRRRVLKALGTATLLPLSSVGLASVQYPSEASASLIPTTAAGVQTPAVGELSSVSFKGMAAPSLDNPAEMAINHVGSKLNVHYATGHAHTYSLGYESFFLTGDLVPSTKGGKIVAGGAFTIDHKPIMDVSSPNGRRQIFSDAPDGTSLLTLSNPKARGVKGKPVFAVVQFEYVSRDLSGADQYGKIPSSVAVLTLDQNPNNGALSLVRYHHVDTSSVHGLWITCGSSLSPWNTHLSSEEYEPDAFETGDTKGAKQFRAFSQNFFGDAHKANPYHYGHMPEVTVLADGTGSIKKHYCMGRISHELVQMMPDERTALMGDDSTNAGLFMFVADKPRDLSSGHLYVAKVGQGFSVDPKAAPCALTWVHLGHASSAQIEHLANTLKPTDIMDVSMSDPLDTTFTKIYINGKPNWVKVKPGMELAAAFLETHRYAALLGGSMGYTKMEGTTVNVKDKIAYSALAAVRDSMVHNGKGWYAQSGIALEQPLHSGAVMALKLAGGQFDTQGKKIESEWVAINSRALVVGEDLKSPDKLGNTAHADKIANPDNLKFSEKLRTLFIGEDSGMHVNNFVWAYDVDKQSLTRLMSVPVGAEATGLCVADNIHGWTYIMSNFQHAGDWEAIHQVVKPSVESLINQNYRQRFGAAVGYLTAIETGLKL